MAMSAPTRNCRAVDVGAWAVLRPSPCSDACRSVRDALMAGIRPNRKAVVSESAIEKASVRPSIPAPDSRDIVDGARWTRTGTAAALSSTHSTAAATASRPLSNHQLPDDARAAGRGRPQRKNRARGARCARQQAGDMAQAINSTNPTAPISTPSAGRMPRELVFERHQRHRRRRIVRRVFATQLRLDRVDVGARGLERDIRFEAADRLQMLAAAAAVGGAASYPRSAQMSARV